MQCKNGTPQEQIVLSKLKLYNQVKTELGFDRVGKNPGNKLIAQPSGFSWVYPGFSGICG